MVVNNLLVERAVTNVFGLIEGDEEPGMSAHTRPPRSPRHSVFKQNF